MDHLNIFFRIIYIFIELNVIIYMACIIIYICILPIKILHKNNSQNEIILYITSYCKVILLKKINLTNFKKLCEFVILLLYNAFVKKIY